MAKASLSGATQALMMVNFIKTISMDKESMFGQMVEYTEENGSTTKWKVQVCSHGVTAVDMQVNTRMIRSMDKEHLNGLMVASIQVCGAKANNMDRAHISKKVRKEKESGTWARELNGLRTNEYFFVPRKQNIIIYSILSLKNIYYFYS